jgi:hypothetical protein
VRSLVTFTNIEPEMERVHENGIALFFCLDSCNNNNNKGNVVVVTPGVPTASFLFLFTVSRLNNGL